MLLNKNSIKKIPVFKNMKNEYVKLQWRYMLQDDKYRKVNKSYLPPLSLKATLNQQQQQQQEFKTN